MNMKHLKKAAAVSLAALAAAGMIAGCGGEKKASAPSSQPAAQTVKINFPTVGVSGVLFVVGAVIFFFHGYLNLSGKINRQR